MGDRIRQAALAAGLFATIVGGASAALFAIAPRSGAPALALAEVIGSLPEVMAALLGIALTVVAIVVQLAAARYPAKIVDIFMREPINVATFGFMTASCVFVVIAPMASGSEPARWMSVAVVVINFGLLLPYFGHVFSSLEPTNLITKMRRRASRALRPGPGREYERGKAVVDALERVADNALAAIAASDRALAMHTVNTIRDIAVEYLPRKGAVPVRAPRDFLGTMADEFLRAIERDGTWVEAKALAELERIVRHALGEMDEVVGPVAAAARAIGRRAAETRDEHAIDLIVRFFNTFVRHALNARNVRAAYSVLYEYRRLAETLIRTDPERVETIAGHLVYYGRTANSIGLPFVTVTAAHDVRSLCESALTAKLESAERILEQLLSLDQPADSAGQEAALLGVRRAQAILAARLVELGRGEMVARIIEDMGVEPDARLDQIERDIGAVTEHHFWEITDRGFNFDYVEPALRPALARFFARLREERGGARSVRAGGGAVLGS